MTNIALIQKLQGYPPDAEIFIADNDGAGEGRDCVFLGDISKIMYYQNTKRGQKLIQDHYVTGDETVGKKVIVLH